MIPFTNFVWSTSFHALHDHYGSLYALNIRWPCTIPALRRAWRAFFGPQKFLHFHATAHHIPTSFRNSFEHLKNRTYKSSWEPAAYLLERPQNFRYQTSSRSVLCSAKYRVLATSGVSWNESAWYVGGYPWACIKPQNSRVDCLCNLETTGYQNSRIKTVYESTNCCISNIRLLTDLSRGIRYRISPSHPGRSTSPPHRNRTLALSDTFIQISWRTPTQTVKDKFSNRLRTSNLASARPRIYTTLPYRYRLRNAKGDTVWVC